MVASDATITFYLEEEPLCPDCPASVALCVPSSIVAPGTCPDESAETYVNRHIVGTMTNKCYVDVGCGQAKWKITVTYDDTQLAEGAVLTAALVLGVVCLESCLFKVIEDRIGDPIDISYDAETQTLTIVDARGCVTEVTLDTLNEVLLGDGSAADPSLSFQSEQTSGLYRAGAGQIGVSVLGANVATINSGGITLPVTNVAAGGTGVIGDATQLTTGVFYVTNAAVGNAVKLPVYNVSTSPVGSVVEVHNFNNANDLTIFPGSASEDLGRGNGSSGSISTNSTMVARRITTTRWAAFEAPRV